MKKKNSGITLVALVITIIVLIILAGVSINTVMNGGLIDNAKVAKDEFSKTADSETKDIDSLTLKTDLLVAKATSEKAGEANENTLVASRGILTGIDIGTTVSELESMLPEGYSVLKADGNGFDDEEKDENGKTEKEKTKVGTGMQIVKNGVEVSKVVIYGDVDGSGTISLTDVSWSESKVLDNYRKVAGDVNLDGFINIEDRVLITNSSLEEYEIKQNVESQDGAKIVVELTEEYYGRQIDNLGISDKIIKKEWYFYEYYDEENDVEIIEEYYKVYIQPDTITVGECLSKNTEDGNYKMSVTGKTDKEVYIENGDVLKLKKIYEGKNVFKLKQIAKFIISE